MPVIAREMTREELVDEINKLREINKKLKAELEETRAVAEQNRDVANDNQRERELFYRDGVIYGMKYALRCNGVSGGEVDKKNE